MGGVTAGDKKSEGIIGVDVAKSKTPSVDEMIWGKKK